MTTFVHLIFTLFHSFSINTSTVFSLVVVIKLDFNELHFYTNKVRDSFCCLHLMYRFFQWCATDFMNECCYRNVSKQKVAKNIEHVCVGVYLRMCTIIKWCLLFILSCLTYRWKDFMLRCLTYRWRDSIQRFVERLTPR